MARSETHSRTFVLIEIKAAAGKEAACRDRFHFAIQTAHKPGIVSAEIFDHAARADVFLSLQEWESEAAFRQHMSDSAEGLKESSEFLDGPPKLTVLTLAG